jgi:hypothetical protein
VTSMHFIGLDIHKKTISYCVKDVSGKVLPLRIDYCAVCEVDAPTELVSVTCTEPIFAALPLMAKICV